MALTLWSNLYPGIYIDGTGEFWHEASSALQRLAIRPIGADLLKILSLRSRGVGMSRGIKEVEKFLEQGLIRCVIRRGTPTLNAQTGGAFAYRAAKPNVPISDDLSNVDEVALGSDVTERKAAAPGVIFSLPGLGTSSVAAFDPDINFGAVLGMPTPTHIALGHELCHCMHFMSGDTNRHTTAKEWDAKDTYVKHEEARTVGIGIYKNTRISENALRGEWKLPLRTYYSQPGDCDGLTSVLK